MSADLLYAAFPWLNQLGLTSQVRNWIAQGLEGDALLNAIRQTPQYQSMFPWIRRDDGTLRMTESEYLTTQDKYRELHRQFGFEEPKNPMEYGSYFQGEVSPAEIKDRFETYKNLERSGREVREAFYIYAGMDLSTDDLYRAVTQPQAARALQDEYNARVAAQPLDYETWITRATEVGLNRVADELYNQYQQGTVTGTAVERVRKLDPQFARQMMDVLYTGGDPQGGSFISSMDELMATFEEALIGGAAKQAGFELPDRDRVQQLRQAGVTRAQALKAYGEFGSKKNLVSGAANRAGFFGSFGGREYESAEWLGDSTLRQVMDQAMAQEKAAGQGGGGVDAQMTRSGVQQSGFQASRY